MKKITLSEQKLLSIIKKTISEINLSEPNLNETSGSRCPDGTDGQSCAGDVKGYCCSPYKCCNLGGGIHNCCFMVPPPTMSIKKSKVVY
jgi:hypothetical protein